MQRTLRNIPHLTFETWVSKWPKSFAPSANVRKLHLEEEESCTIFLEEEGPKHTKDDGQKVSTRDLRKCRTIKSAIPKTSYLSISHQMLTSLPLQLSPVSIPFFGLPALVPKINSQVATFFQATSSLFFPAFFRYLFHNNVEELNMLRANHQTHLRYGSRLALPGGIHHFSVAEDIFRRKKSFSHSTTVRLRELLSK